MSETKRLPKVTAFKKGKGSASGIYFQGVSVGLKLPGTQVQIAVVAADIESLRKAWPEVTQDLIDLDETGVQSLVVFQDTALAQGDSNGS